MSAHRIKTVLFSSVILFGTLILSASSHSATQMDRLPSDVFGGAPDGTGSATSGDCGDCYVAISDLVFGCWGTNPCSCVTRYRDIFNDPPGGIPDAECPENGIEYSNGVFYKASDATDSTATKTPNARLQIEQKVCKTEYDCVTRHQEDDRACVNLVITDPDCGWLFSLFSNCALCEQGTTGDETLVDNAVCVPCIGSSLRAELSQMQMIRY